MFLQRRVRIDPLVDRYQQGMESSLYFLQVRLFQKDREDRLWH